ncbi:malate dehydrogenase [Rothia sp. P6271]|uniref:malate dehydrogenase n=1 Tax=Rothia sp. P6271 TaxID=3402659 RepID=UPI003AC950AD
MLSSYSDNVVTVTLTGAAGNIGYAALFRIASGEWLGPNTKIRLNLLDLPQAMSSLEGVAMELEDCAFSHLSSINIYDDPYQGFDGTDIALLVGARPRTQGMQRADLLEANAGIFSVQGQALNEQASSQLRVVVVGNPANTNALICSSFAPDIPLSRFSALTRLDHQRAQSMIAKTLAVEVQKIAGVSIWGNHSATQYPDIFHATVDGIAVVDALKQQGKGMQWIEEEFISRIAHRGAEVIQKRGSSSAASAASAMLEHMRLWLGSEPVQTSMAVASDGSYGVAPGVFCSFPVLCSRGQWQIIPGLLEDEFSREYVRRSVDELFLERESVARLGLLGPRG